MPRKRKLYVSEFLNRNSNKTITYVFIVKNTPVTCEDKKTALQYKDKEIKQWYYNEYYGFVIFIE